MNVLIDGELLSENVMKMMKKEKNQIQSIQFTVILNTLMVHLGISSLR